MAILVACLCVSTAFGSTVVGSADYNPLEAMTPFIKASWDPRYKVGHLSDEDRNAACTACSFFVNEITDLYDSGASAPEMVANLTHYCTATGISSEECDLLFTMYMDEIWYMLTKNEISNDTMCAILLNDGCGTWEMVNDWHTNVSIYDRPLPITPEMPPLAGLGKSKILHLSDMHLDLTYLAGSTGEGCDQIMCCTDRSQFPANASVNQVAGDWGTLGPCNMPEDTFRDMLEQIVANHNISWVYLTGDYPAHDLPYQSRTRNLQTIETAATIVKQVFGAANIPIYPSIGNHDSYPCNSFPTDDNIDDVSLRDDWIYGNLTDFWGEWLTQEALNTFSKYGYYTMSISPTFRIVAINSNFCVGYNFWMNHNWIDPYGQLDWLVSVLSLAEDQQQQVHILSHVPPNAECLGAWGREYGKILDRFQNTVMNSFYGHTHKDEFFVVYDHKANYNTAVHVGFITPSVTTWQYYHPSYRMYTIDGPYTTQMKTITSDDGKNVRINAYPNGSMRVIDAQTYIMNITEANAAGAATKPVYELFYDMRTDLGMNSLFPNDFDHLIDRLTYDDALWSKFEFYYNNGNGNSANRDKVICDLATWSTIIHDKCDQFVPK